MKDSQQPTPGELRSWLYDKSAPQPGQDWDLTIIQYENLVRIMVECLGDDACPKKDFLKRCIFTYMQDGGIESVKKIKTFIEAIPVKNKDIIELLHLISECSYQVSRYVQMVLTTKNPHSAMMDFIKEYLVKTKS